MAIAISFSWLSLHNFFRLVLALSPSRLTKSKIQAIGLHEQLYEPNRQISRSLFTFSPYAYTLMWGLCPAHPRPKPLPKSKGSATFSYKYQSYLKSYVSQEKKLDLFR
jgi:hypothetical protein